MEKSTEDVEEIGNKIVPTSWLTWDITFDRRLPLDEIPREMPLIQKFLDEYLSKFLVDSKYREKRIYKYKWTNVKQGSRSYKLEIYSSAKVVLTICKDDNHYVLFDEFEEAAPPKGSDKNTVKLKPPAI